MAVEHVMGLPDPDLIISIEVDGETLPCYLGQTVAAALLSAGRQVLRYSPSGAPRGLFCGMGVCFDCLVEIDGVADQRACIRLVRPGMRIRLGAPPLSAHGTC